MKNLFFAPLLMIIIGLSSCGNSYKEEIKEVEEMQQVLQGVKQTYSQVDVEKVTFAMETYVKNMNQIKTYYKPDSTDEKVTSLLNFYKGIKHSAKGFEDEYTAVGLNIEFLESQLATLKTDLENNAEFNDSLDIFLQNERENLELLNQNVGTLVYNYDFVVSVHDSLAAKVQNILLQNVE